MKCKPVSRAVEVSMMVGGLECTVTATVWREPETRYEPGGYYVDDLVCMRDDGGAEIALTKTDSERAKCECLEAFDRASELDDAD